MTGAETTLPIRAAPISYARHFSQIYSQSPQKALFCGLFHQVVHGKEQQRYRGQALLTIDYKELLVMTVRIVCGNRAAEKVTLTVSINNFYGVLQKI